MQSLKQTVFKKESETAVIKHRKKSSEEIQVMDVVKQEAPIVSELQAK